MTPTQRRELERLKYGTVEYYVAKLAAEGDEHNRRCALVGRLRECIEREDLERARNVLAAFDRLHEAEAVSGS